jgi:RNA polymerase sigma-70 factor, ECF subfamily
MATESCCTIGLMNEMSLVARAKSGETAAFDLPFIAHKEKLFRTVFRITRNHQGAEDAMQDSLLSAFLHLKSFYGRSTFSTWLTRSGIESALMTLRRKGKYRAVSAQGRSENSMVPEEADLTANPEHHHAQQARARLVRKAIADLRLSIRRPVEPHALPGHSMKEMAGGTGVSIAAAKRRLHHAKITLRKPKAFRNVNDRYWRRCFSNLQNQRQP